MGLFDILKNKAAKNVNYENSTKNEESISIDSEFYMVVEDVFNIKGKGLCVTGKIQKGSLSIGEKVKINGEIECEVILIEMFRKLVDTCKTGDNVNIYLTNIIEGDIEKGDYLIK